MVARLFHNPNINIKNILLILLTIFCIGQKTFAYDCAVGGIAYNLNYNTASVTYFSMEYNHGYYFRDIIRKSKFSPNPKRSVHFSSVHSKRNVQKKDLRTTQTIKPEIRAKITLFRALSNTIQQAI